jgi:hypothetical protein
LRCAALRCAAALRAAGLCDGDALAAERLLHALQAGREKRERADGARALSLAREAARRDWSGAEQPLAAGGAGECGVLPQGALQLCHAPPSPMQALCYAACAQPRGAAAGGASALLHRNALHRLAQLCAAGACALGAGLALRCAGDAALGAACEAQAEEAVGALQAAEGFGDAAGRQQAVSGALRAAFHAALRWWRLAEELLPAAVAHSAGVAPLERVGACVVDSLLRLTDIGADDCAALCAALDAAMHEAGAELTRAAEHCPSWPRILMLRKVLAGSLRSFVAEEEYRRVLSAAELRHLALAIFESTPLREQVLTELSRQL